MSLKCRYVSFSFFIILISNKFHFRNNTRPKNISYQEKLLFIVIVISHFCPFLPPHWGNNKIMQRKILERKPKTLSEMSILQNKFLLCFVEWQPLIYLLFPRVVAKLSQLSKLFWKKIWITKFYVMFLAYNVIYSFSVIAYASRISTKLDIKTFLCFLNKKQRYN